MRKKRKWLGILAPVFLSVLFCLISIVALISMVHMRGNARVVNYTGIVRGATQRLVKQEMNGYNNEKLVYYLEDIMSELVTGEGDYDLTRLPDEAFQDFIMRMQGKWIELKEEILLVREGADSQKLFQLSEDYFELADQAVSAAERYSEQSVRDSIVILLCLNIGFIVLGVLFLGGRRRQRKVQMALEMSENANQAKSEFFSRMSHEIRTPMNGIIGMTAIAKKNTDNPEKVADCLNKIDRSAVYLMALLNDVLDMSRIESGKMELEEQPFRLRDVLEQIEVMFHEKAAAKGVALNVSDGNLSVQTVVGDYLRLSQVLVNLVSNAVKFTPSGGTVTLSVKEIQVSSKEARLEFAVADTGTGISEEFQAHIFDPFEQEYLDTARQYGGTGLGLSISSNFVKLMGGNIGVKSKLGEGATFIVDLAFPLPEENGEPKRSEDTLGKVYEQDVAVQLKRAGILLAEDNEINAEIVTELLKESGAQVDLAVNGKIAVERFKESQKGTYSIILMDIQMPVMDGIEAARAIRASGHPDAQKVLIIGLSANAFQEDIDRAVACGMNGYLCKPIEPEQLYEVLESFLKNGEGHA